MVHVAPGELADGAPQVPQGSVELGGCQEPVNGRAGGSLVESLDSSLGSVGPTTTHLLTDHSKVLLFL